MNDEPNPSGTPVVFSGSMTGAWWLDSRMLTGIGPAILPLTPQEQYVARLELWRDQVHRIEATIKPDLPWWKKLFVGVPQLPPEPSEWNPPELISYCLRKGWVIAANYERIDNETQYALYRETNGKDGSSRYYFIGHGERVYIDGPTYERFRKIIPLT